MRRGKAFEIDGGEPGRTSISYLPPTGRVRTFAPTPELLHVPIADGRPARRPATYAKKRNTEGFYWFEQTRRHVWHESMEEYSALMFLDHTVDIKAVCTQPVRLDFEDGTRHFPDIFAVYQDGTQGLINVRPEALLDAKAAEQFKKTSAVCKQIGWSHRVIVDTATVRMNLEVLAGYRHPRNEPTDLVADVLLSAAEEPTTFGALWAITRGHCSLLAGLYNLLWHRELTFDMTQPLQMFTPIWRP